jgi:hypothetical protein
MARFETFHERSFALIEKTDSVQRWRRFSGPLEINLWKKSTYPYGCSVTFLGILLYAETGSDPHELVRGAVSLLKQVKTHARALAEKDM